MFSYLLKTLTSVTYKVLSHKHCRSTLWEGVSSACELLHPVTPSTRWWEPGDLAPALACCQTVVCRGHTSGWLTNCHSHPLSTCPHYPLPPPGTGTSGWPPCLQAATRRLFSIFFVLRGIPMLAGPYWQMLPPQSPLCSKVPLPMAGWGDGKACACGHSGTSGSCSPGHTMLVCESHSK